MAVSEAPIARVDFGTGPLRGTELALYRNCLVHRGAGEIETVPLAAIASLRVAFERDSRKLGWGIAVAMVALVLLAVAGPLSSFAGHAVADLTSAGGQGVARALISFFRVLEALATFLPVIALACALGAAALIVRGWQGSTTLSVLVGGTERVFLARGRDARLLDFAERVGDRLMAPAAGAAAGVSAAAPG